MMVEHNVFQLNELVDLYRDAPSNDLEENSNFHVAENTFVNVDVDELNNVLRTSGHTQVDEDDDNDEINVEDCNGHDNDEIKEEDKW